MQKTELKLKEFIDVLENQYGKGLFVSFCNARLQQGVDILREKTVVDYTYDKEEHLVYVWLDVKITKGTKTITCFKRDLWEMEDTNGFYLIDTQLEAEKWLNS